MSEGMRVRTSEGGGPSRQAKVAWAGVAAGGGKASPRLRDDGGQGRRYRHRRTVVVPRWDATRRWNTGATCGASARPDESQLIPSQGKKRPLRVTGSRGFDLLDRGVRATRLDGDLHSIFHGIFEGHLDSEQAVLVDRFGFVRFHWPS